MMETNEDEQVLVLVNMKGTVMFYKIKSTDFAMPDGVFLEW